MTINETVPAEMIESVDSHITVTGADDTGKTVTGELIPQSRLLFFENAKSALAQATTINEVKSVRDKAIGLVAYAKKATDHELEADAEAIRLEAERLLGQMMRKQKETVGLNEGGRPKTGFSGNPVSSKPTLAEAGIDKNLADRARKFAAMPEEEFKEAVEAKREVILTPPPRPRRSRDEVRLERFHNAMPNFCAATIWDGKIPPGLTAERAAICLPDVRGAIKNLKKLEAALAEIADGGDEARRVH
jgi:hypothetical protein